MNSKLNLNFFKKCFFICEDQTSPWIFVRGIPSWSVKMSLWQGREVMAEPHPPPLGFSSKHWSHPAVDRGWRLVSLPCPQLFLMVPSAQRVLASGRQAGTIARSKHKGLRVTWFRTAGRTWVHSEGLWVSALSFVSPGNLHQWVQVAEGGVLERACLVRIRQPQARCGCAGKQTREEITTIQEISGGRMTRREQKEALGQF